MEEITILRGEIQELRISIVKLEAKFEAAKDLIENFADSIEELTPMIKEMDRLSTELKDMETRIANIADVRINRRLNGKIFSEAIDTRIDEKVTASRLTWIVNMTKWVIGVLVSIGLMYLGTLGG